MDIILLERVGGLGSIGDVVTVKDGYARNFLLPQKKALRANEANRKVFEANRDKLESENAQKRGSAQEQGEKVAGTEIVLIRAASNAGQLYGSVNVRDVAAGLADKGHDIDKKQVIMGAPIKTIGMFDVTVRLHPEVEVLVKANVARSDDEAELQSQGIDVIAQMNEEEMAADAEAGFQHELDPDRELGDLPAAEEGEASEEAGDDAGAEEAEAAEGGENAEG